MLNSSANNSILSVGQRTREGLRRAMTRLRHRIREVFEPRQRRVQHVARGAKPAPGLRVKHARLFLPRAEIVLFNKQTTCSLGVAKQPL